MKNNRNGKTEKGSEHHIMPTSRGGKDCPENKSLHHTQRDHEAYHVIFSNMVPEEIGPFLARYWWQDYFTIAVTMISNGHGTVGGSNLARRKSLHTQKEMSAYWELFHNMNPVKIMDYLAKSWWNNKYSIEFSETHIKALNKHNSNSVSPVFAYPLVAG